MLIQGLVLLYWKLWNLSSPKIHNISLFTTLTIAFSTLLRGRTMGTTSQLLFSVLMTKNRWFVLINSVALMLKLKISLSFQSCLNLHCITWTCLTSLPCAIGTVSMIGCGSMDRESLKLMLKWIRQIQIRKDWQIAELKSWLSSIRLIKFRGVSKTIRLYLPKITRLHGK